MRIVRLRGGWWACPQELRGAQAKTLTFKVGITIARKILVHRGLVCRSADVQT
ncbi:MAG: hypothetical protein IJG53_01550 [Eggerthellaceae bacterium]|nr:hypothetical protein [Eggerthellaceae bacterium]